MQRIVGRDMISLQTLPLREDDNCLGNIHRTLPERPLRLSVGMAGAKPCSDVDYVVAVYLPIA